MWPDCWPAVQFFAALGAGCWQVGPTGQPTGLRYESFREVRLARGVRSSGWPQIFSDIQVMERAALDLMRSQHGG